jgi:hypothetical protein
MSEHPPELVALVELAAALTTGAIQWGLRGAGHTAPPIPFRWPAPDQLSLGSARLGLITRDGVHTNVHKLSPGVWRVEHLILGTREEDLRKLCVAYVADVVDRMEAEENQVTPLILLTWVKQHEVPLSPQLRARLAQAALLERVMKLQESQEALARDLGALRALLVAFFPDASTAGSSDPDPTPDPDPETSSNPDPNGGDPSDESQPSTHSEDTTTF